MNERVRLDRHGAAGRRPGPVRRPLRGQGCLYTLVIGVLGALIGGALSAAAGVGDGVSGFNLGTFVIAFLGACLLLLVLYALGGRSHARR